MSPLLSQHYHAPWWLPEKHSHTIYGARYAPCPSIDWQRQTIPTPDQDFLDMDLLLSPQAKGTLILLHGLEGSSESRYIRSLAHQANTQHFNVVVPNFRGCSGRINIQPRMYHAGDSAELNWLIPTLHSQFSHSPLFIVGFSLGANLLLKWLADQRHTNLIDGAMAVAPPLNLEVVANTLSHGFNRVYSRYFLSTLKPKALIKAQQFPNLFNLKRVLAARSMFDFDEYFVGPVHGFSGALDYWHQSSAGPLLKQITTNTLIIMSQDDPFIPSHLIPNPANLPPSVKLLTTSQGGHVGYVSGPFPGFLSWLPDTILSFAQQNIAHQDKRTKS